MFETLFTDHPGGELLDRLGIEVLGTQRAGRVSLYNVRIDQTIQPVPEPGSIIVLCCGIAALLPIAAARRKAGCTLCRPENRHAAGTDVPPAVLQLPTQNSEVASRLTERAGSDRSSRLVERDCTAR